MASSSRLQPGEKGTIKTQVNTVNRKGVLVKTIEVLSNDPKRPKTTLTLQVDVREPKRPTSQN